MNPRAKLRSVPYEGLKNPRISDLNGKTIGILSEKPDAEMFFDCIQDLLNERYTDLTFKRYGSPSSPICPDNAEQVTSECDCWLEGVKTSGSGNRDCGVQMEQLGKPGVVFSCDGLEVQRQRLATCCGMPTLRIVTLPTYKFFANENDPAKFREIAEMVIDDVIKALTSPLTEEEKNPAPMDYDFGPLSFEGENYTDALEKFQQYCLDNGMGDGLPLIPPTKEAVEEMLTGTSLDRNEVLGIMVPRSGVATVEKVAINAVMAGAKPEYLPVIIAGVEAVTSDSFNLFHIDTGTLNSCLLMWVNGPVAREIGMNSKHHYLGPGNRANSSIGRAMSLCMINIGWAILEVETGMLGQPARYCNLVFAENEEQSPWESFAAQQGYGPEDSIVTVDECISIDRDGPMGGMCCMPLEHDMKSLANMLTGLFPPLTPIKGERPRQTQPQAVKETINRRYCELGIYPTTAIQLANAGWTKEAFTKWLCDQHRIPWDEFGAVQQQELLAIAEEGSIPGLTVDDCRSGGTIPTYNYKHVALIVAGGTMGRSMAFRSGGAAMINSDMEGAEAFDFVSKRIRGATLTEHGK